MRKLSISLHSLRKLLLISFFLGAVIGGTLFAQHAVASTSDGDPTTDENGNLIIPAAEINALGNGIVTAAKGTLKFVRHPIDTTLEWTASSMTTVLYEFISLALATSAVFFDSAIYYGVVQFGYFASLPIINQIWTISRDLCNLSFLFILLYAGITTILGVAGPAIRKTTLAVIVAAVLVNFSALFVKLVVDVPNTISVAFYQQLVRAGKGVDPSFVIGTVAPFAPKFNDAISVSSVFANSMNIQTIINPADITDLNGEKRKTLDPNVKEQLIIMVGNSIFMLVAMFVFAAGGFLIIARAITLFFVIALAPLGVAASILPSTQKLAQRWRTALTENAIFPAAFTFGLYIAAQIANASIITEGVRGIVDPLGAAFNGGSIELLFQYVITISAMVGAYAMAKSFGVTGAKQAEAFGSMVSTAGAAFGLSPIRAPLNYVGDAVSKRLDTAATKIGTITGARVLAPGIRSLSSGVKEIGSSVTNAPLGRVSRGIESVAGIKIYNPTAPEDTKKKEESRIGEIIKLVKKGGADAYLSISDSDKKSVYGKLSPADRVDLLSKIVEKKEKTAPGSSEQAKYASMEELISGIKGYRNGLEPDEQVKMEAPEQAYTKKKAISGIMSDLKNPANDLSAMDAYMSALVAAGGASAGKKGGKGTVKFSLAEATAQPYLFEYSNEGGIMQLLLANAGKKADVLAAVSKAATKADAKKAQRFEKLLTTAGEGLNTVYNRI